MTSARMLLLATALVVSSTPRAHAASNPERVLLGTIAGTGEGSTDSSPLDRFVLGWQLADHEMMTVALDTEGWQSHLRSWMKARLAAREGRSGEAREHFGAARAAWPDGAEREVVRAAFDREEVWALLQAGESEAARGRTASALAAHTDDARWNALAALSAWREGVDALADLDRAWARASGVERTHPVFLERAIAHLAAGDSTRAAVVWMESIEDLRRPEHLRDSAAVWDSSAGLRRAVLASTERIEPLLQWHVRLFRRDAALELVGHLLDSKSLSETRRATLFVFGAEQLYRLRRHEDLARWLASTWPDSLDQEQRASLEAYPWGVRRRSGPRRAIARGFDEVASRYHGTDRAAEAVWEAAWMWELCDEPDTARIRFEEYTRRRPDGPYAESAALRAILLPYAAGDHESALAAHDRVQPALGDGMNHAAALLLRARTLERLGRSEEAAVAQAELRDAHPASPLWRGGTDTWTGPGDRGISAHEVAGELFEAQRAAFRRVGEHLGIGDPLSSLPEELEDIRRLLELGLLREGESQLLAYGRARRAEDEQVLRAAAVAWENGSPEIQARIGYFLELRLGGESPELDRVVWAVARPTPYAPAVLEICAELGLPAGLVWSLMRRESFYDADVVSVAGAYGLLQLLPSTAARMARKVGEDEPVPASLYEPGRNLRLGMTYLRQLLDESSGDVSRALASYNAGEAHGARWAARRPADERPTFTILQISYSETRAYVYHVLRHWLIAQDTYAILGRWDGPGGS